MRPQRYVLMVGRPGKEFYFWTRKAALWALRLGLANVPEVGFTAWDRWTGRRLDAGLGRGVPEDRYRCEVEEV